MPAPSDMPGKTSRRSNILSALTLMGVVFGMIGLSFASVPLYRIFCAVTGYGGTTQRVAAATGPVSDREIIVRFDSNVSGLPWTFRAEVPDVHVRLGETTIVNFVAENTGQDMTVGTASFNVQPDAAGAYFNKIECFCFTEQPLAAGEHVEMPVQFFVSPDLFDEPELRSTRTITLSYTMFRKKDAGQPVAQSAADADGKKL